MRDELVREVADRLDVPADYVSRRARRAPRDAAPPRRRSRAAPRRARSPSRRGARVPRALPRRAASSGSEYLSRADRRAVLVRDDAAARAAHLVAHFDDPLAGLPEDDPALGALVTTSCTPREEQPAESEPVLQHEHPSARAAPDRARDPARRPGGRPRAPDRAGRGGSSACASELGAGHGADGVSADDDELGRLRRPGRRGDDEDLDDVGGVVTAGVPVAPPGAGRRGRRSAVPALDRPGAAAHARGRGAPGQAHRAERHVREERADRGEPAAGGVDRQALHGPRADAARPDPGGQPGADPRGREVRLAARLQVLDLRDLVDPPGDHARAGRPVAHDPHPGAHGRADEPRGAGEAIADAGRTTASPRPRRSPSWSR